MRHKPTSLRLHGAARKRALGVMATGWCPWPYLRTPAPDNVDAGRRASCGCGKHVRVTARGFYSHHKMLRRVSVDEVRLYAGIDVEGQIDEMANDGRLTALAQMLAIDAGADWPSLTGDAQDAWHERAIERLRGTDV